MGTVLPGGGSSVPAPAASFGRHSRCRSSRPARWQCRGGAPRDACPGFPECIRGDEEVPRSNIPGPCLHEKTLSPGLDDRAEEGGHVRAIQVSDVRRNIKELTLTRQHELSIGGYSLKIEFSPNLARHWFAA